MVHVYVTDDAASLCGCLGLGYASVSVSGRHVGQGFSGMTGGDGLLRQQRPTDSASEHSVILS